MAAFLDQPGSYCTENPSTTNDRLYIVNMGCSSDTVELPDKTGDIVLLRHRLMIRPKSDSDYNTMVSPAGPLLWGRQWIDTTSSSSLPTISASTTSRMTQHAACHAHPDGVSYCRAVYRILSLSIMPWTVAIRGPTVGLDSALFHTRRRASVFVSQNTEQRSDFDRPYTHEFEAILTSPCCCCCCYRILMIILLLCYFNDCINRNLTRCCIIVVNLIIGLLIIAAFYVV